MAELTAFQRDALCEVANVAAAHAATALGLITGDLVLIGLPTVVPAGPAAAPAEAGALAVTLDLIGELAGRIEIRMPAAAAGCLSDWLLRQTGGGAGASSAELARSSLMETGNILGGTFAGAVAEMTGLVVMISVPEFLDRPGSGEETTAPRIEIAWAGSHGGPEVSGVLAWRPTPGIIPRLLERLGAASA